MVLVEIHLGVVVNLAIKPTLCCHAHECLHNQNEYLFFFTFPSCISHLLCFQAKLSLVAVETQTSPSSSIQTGSVPSSPHFPFQSCFLLLIHASQCPWPQYVLAIFYCALDNRDFDIPGSQQVSFPIIMGSQHR